MTLVFTGAVGVAEGVAVGLTVGVTLGEVVGLGGGVGTQPDIATTTIAQIAPTAM